ncbi:MAG: hypothetical protein HOP35_05650 [Nitrospira sp.]|nr:hypothetical protein [Nitrospira sp.]
MPFSIRPYRRSPVQCFVTDNAGPFEGQGIVWNLSLSGLRLSGDLPIRHTTWGIAFPEPYLLTETENKIIDDKLALLNQNGLTSHQSLNLLERLGRIIEMGQRLAKGTTH